jgi:hypothetical protein
MRNRRRAEVPEEGGWLKGGPFLPREKQGPGRGRQQGGARGAERGRRGEDAAALAEDAVADLIGVLQEPHEGGGREAGAGFPARPAAVG